MGEEAANLLTFMPMAAMHADGSGMPGLTYVLPIVTFSSQSKKRCCLIILLVSGKLYLV